MPLREPGAVQQSGQHSNPKNPPPPPGPPWGSAFCNAYLDLALRPVMLGSAGHVMRWALMIADAAFLTNQRSCWGTSCQHPPCLISTPSPLGGLPNGSLKGSDCWIHGHAGQLYFHEHGPNCSSLPFIAFTSMGSLAGTFWKCLCLQVYFVTDAHPKPHLPRVRMGFDERTWQETLDIKVISPSSLPAEWSSQTPQKVLPSALFWHLSHIGEPADPPLRIRNCLQTSEILNVEMGAL